MSRIAFAIQTHFVDDRVLELAQSLADAGPVDLSIDAEIDRATTARLDTVLPPEAWRRSRPVTWCGPSQVLAFIDSVKRLLVMDPDWDWLVNVSGDTMILRAPEEIGGVLDRLPVDTDALLHRWRLAKPPERIEANANATIAPPDQRYRGRFAISSDLRSMFDEEVRSPLRYAASRFFVACEEDAVAKILTLRGFERAELDDRATLWSQIAPGCSRAYHVLRRSFCERLIDAIAGEHRILYARFIASFEPDETWLPCLLSVMRARVAAPIDGSTIHHAGGSRRPLDPDELAFARASGAFFGRARRRNPQQLARLHATILAMRSQS